MTAFAYPYGTLADFDPAVQGILAACGYVCAFTSQHGAVRPGLPLALPRVKVEAGDGASLFPRLCGGSLDGWRVVDRALWRLQRPQRARPPESPRANRHRTSREAASGSMGKVLGVVGGDLLCQAGQLRQVAPHRAAAGLDPDLSATKALGNYG